MTPAANMCVFNTTLLRSIAARVLATLTLPAAVPSATAQAPGSLDTGFNPDVTGAVEVYVMATAVQPNGKTVIGGSFNKVGGATHLSLARLNADGTVDSSFTASTEATVQCMAVQADGKLVIGGNFTSVNGKVGINCIARLNANGTRDTAFHSDAVSGGVRIGVVHSVALQADGKIVMGGYFNSVNGVTGINHIARLKTDGTLDTAFNVGGIGTNDQVYSVAVQSDGKLVIGGAFTSVNGTPGINRIARLNADGTLDASFNIGGAGANNVVHSVALQADRKVVLGGSFTSMNGTAGVNRIARLNANGTRDTSFNPGVGAGPSGTADVYAVTVQADGKLLLGGNFAQVNGASGINGIARLNADGTRDTGFNAGGDGANGVVRSVAVQADGKIVLGGPFTTMNATTRRRAARLNNDAATQTLTAPDRTRVQWQRGGSSPEVSQVTIEQSTDGGTTWTVLGNVARVGTTSNWEVTGLSLPASGVLRARGRAVSGYNSGSSGLMQTLAGFSVIAPDIAVESPAGTGLADGRSSVSFGTVNLASSSAATSFTIKNTGTADLSGLAVSKGGVNAADFTVSALGSTTVTPGDSATFTVTFTPSASGVRNATIRIASNFTGSKNPFDIALTGMGNTLPTAPDAIVAATSGEPETITLPFLSPDADGDTVTLTNTTPDSHLTVDGTNGNNVTFTPRGDYAGLAMLGYEVSDGRGGTARGTITVAIKRTAVLFKGGEVAPSAGALGGPPTDARLASFGVPAINDAGDVAFTAQWDSPLGPGTGMFVGNPVKLVAQVGGQAPGLGGPTFKALADPVLDAAGRIAFLATLGGASKVEDSALVTYAPDALQVVAREGGSVNGPGTLQIKSFGEVSLVDGEVLFTAMLKGAGVTRANDAAAFRVTSGEIERVVREGDPVGASTVKAFKLLGVMGGSPGQSRGHTTAGKATFLALLADGSQAIVDSAGGVLTKIVATGDVTGGALLPAATFKSFGVVAASGGRAAFLAALNVDDEVTTANARGVFVGDGSAFEPVARATEPVPGIADASFKAFLDPVLARDSESVAFPATLRGPGIRTGNDGAILYRPAGAPLRAIAREGGQPPGTDSRTKWRRFVSLALPGGSTGPLFQATLVRGAGGVNATNDAGVWAVDSTGALRLLFREGDPIGDETVKTFTVLNAVRGSTGATRAFNNAAQVVWRANFAGGSSAIVVTSVP